MKFHFLSVVILGTFFISGCGKEKTSPHVAFEWNVDSARYDFAKYVDPMIGTAGHGHTFPGATAPFGMVQLSPDTRVDGSWDGCSGYHYDDDTIYGFSHTHLSGTGCSDYGDFLFMPGSGVITFNNGADGKSGYCSSFDHKNEKAEAGYYSVVLNNTKTKTELTASPRVGVHRYSFGNKENNWMMIDLKHRDEVIDSKIEIVNDHAIKGYRISKAWAEKQEVFFYAEFSKEIDLVTFSLGSKDQQEKQMSMSGNDVKLALSFKNPDNEPLIVKVAISPVSSENAQLNMESEVPDFDFDAIHKKVVQQWNNELGKIEVKTNDETKKKIFYTALYHCFIAPNLYCDVNGDYRGRDNKIHTDTIHPQYTVFSLWDTYRALHPLFTIIQQKRDQDFINTFVKQAQEGGFLPVWELSANETNCMIGYHAVPVIVDAWMKGLTDFDTANAYEAMVASAMQDDRGLEAYKKYGFIPAEGESESVSKTLEYAYDDWCIALAAKRMRNDSDYNYFMRRSQSWKNLYDPNTGFFRPRLNNSFVEPFDPNEVNFHYTEANAWQYSLAVQQNAEGLLEAHGGDKKFSTFLDSLFSHSSKTSGRDQADISGMIGQYAQGNEPSHHMAYLYNFTSEPWKTQELVSKICNELYTDKPDGLCGNEDCGQMSAWYVLSSIGFYEVTPCSNEFQVGSPQFDEVIFHLENGKTFNLIAENASNKNKYLSTIFISSFLGGYYNTINYNLINNGGELKLKMQDSPGIEFPSHPNTDYLTATGEYIDAPRISNISGRTFTKELQIKLTTNFSQSIIHYQINDGKWDEYSGLISLHEHATLRCYATQEIMTNEMLGISPLVAGSDTSFAEFFKAPGYNSITIANSFAPQYAAGGDRALIDGIRGADNFRTGDWQGYEGKDLDAVIDLGATKDITHIATGFLQDQNAWIFFPSEVIFYSSMDGKNFTEIETNKNTFKQDSQTVLLHEFYTDKPTKARYIKVVAKNSGLCPAWHPGNGHPSWIFADEIVIQTK